jgi:hypothetical protein
VTGGNLNGNLTDINFAGGEILKIKNNLDCIKSSFHDSLDDLAFYFILSHL